MTTSTTNIPQVSLLAYRPRNGILTRHRCGSVLCDCTKQIDLGCPTYFRPSPLFSEHRVSRQCPPTSILRTGHDRSLQAEGDEDPHFFRPTHGHPMDILVSNINVMTGPRDPLVETRAHKVAVRDNADCSELGGPAEGTAVPDQIVKRPRDPVATRSNPVTIVDGTEERRTPAHGCTCRRVHFGPCAGVRAQKNARRLRDRTEYPEFRRPCDVVDSARVRTLSVVVVVFPFDAISADPRGCSVLMNDENPKIRRPTRSVKSQCSGGGGRRPRNLVGYDDGRFSRRLFEFFKCTWVGGTIQEDLSPGHATNLARSKTMNHSIVHGSLKAQTPVFPRSWIVAPYVHVPLRSHRQIYDVRIIPDVMIHSLDNLDWEGIHRLGTDDGGFLYNLVVVVVVRSTKLSARRTSRIVSTSSGM